MHCMYNTLARRPMRLRKRVEREVTSILMRLLASAQAVQAGMVRPDQPAKLCIINLIVAIAIQLVQEGVEVLVRDHLRHEVGAVKELLDLVPFELVVLALQYKLTGCT